MSLLDELKKKKEKLSKIEKVENLTIKPLHFKNSQWNEVEFEEISKIEKLKIVTFNVWSNKKYIQERMIILVQLLEKINPDIINIQENTTEAQQIFENSKFYQNNFYLSTFQGQSGGFKVSIFSKIPFSHLELRYAKKRPFLKAKFGSNLLSISNVHLSAENQVNDRKEELEYVYQLNKESPNSIVLGDFNIQSEDEMKTIEEFSFQDAWKKDDQPTFRFQRKKFDRVTFKMKDFSLNPKEIIGIEKVNNLIISDHFGLLFEIQMNKK
jgi:exonuclease III